MDALIRLEEVTERPADLRYQAKRDARARTAYRAHRTPARLNVDDARRRALLASSLQRSDATTADVVAEAIRITMRQFGTDGCTSRMAQEFGDHPEAAAERMRWVRSLLSSPKTRVPVAH